VNPAAYDSGHKYIKQVIQGAGLRVPMLMAPVFSRIPGLGRIILAFLGEKGISY
jgi:hypothetical protein